MNAIEALCQAHMICPDAGDDEHSFMAAELLVGDLSVYPWSGAINVQHLDNVSRMYYSAPANLPDMSGTRLTSLRISSTEYDDILVPRLPKSLRGLRLNNARRVAFAGPLPPSLRYLEVYYIHDGQETLPALPPSLKFLAVPVDLWIRLDDIPPGCRRNRKPGTF